MGKDKQNGVNIGVIGTSFVDIKGYPLGKYIPNGRNAGRIENVHGGVGRNVAEDIARAGYGVTFISLVNDDATGKDVVARLDSSGVNTEYVGYCDRGMGTWMAIFDESGDVAANISIRPDLTPILDILEAKGDEIFEKIDSIGLELDMGKEIAQKVYELARKHNVPVYVLVSNIGIAMDNKDFLAMTECFVCNQQEAGQFFGQDYDNLDREEMALVLKDKISEIGVKTMIVTMGGDGSAYANADGQCGSCPSEKVNVVDTTGAGDSFFAGIIMAMTDKALVADACKVGTLIAADVIGSEENVCSDSLKNLIKKVLTTSYNN